MNMKKIFKNADVANEYARIKDELSYKNGNGENYQNENGYENAGIGNGDFLNDLVNNGDLNEYGMINECGDAVKWRDNGDLNYVMNDDFGANQVLLNEMAINQNVRCDEMIDNGIGVEIYGPNKFMNDGFTQNMRPKYDFATSNSLFISPLHYSNGGYERQMDALNRVDSNQALKMPAQWNKCSNKSKSQPTNNINFVNDKKMEIQIPVKVRKVGRPKGSKKKKPNEDLITTKKEGQPNQSSKKLISTGSGNQTNAADTNKVLDRISKDTNIKDNTSRVQISKDTIGKDGDKIGFKKPKNENINPVISLKITDDANLSNDTIKEKIKNTKISSASTILRLPIKINAHKPPFHKTPEFLNKFIKTSILPPRHFIYNFNGVCTVDQFYKTILNFNMMLGLDVPSHNAFTVLRDMFFFSIKNGTFLAPRNYNVIASKLKNDFSMFRDMYITTILPFEQFFFGRQRLVIYSDISNKEKNGRIHFKEQPIEKMQENFAQKNMIKEKYNTNDVIRGNVKMAKNEQLYDFRSTFNNLNSSKENYNSAGSNMQLGSGQLKPSSNQMQFYSENIDKTNGHNHLGSNHMQFNNAGNDLSSCNKIKPNSNQMQFNNAGNTHSRRNNIDSVGHQMQFNNADNTHVSNNIKPIGKQIQLNGENTDKTKRNIHSGHNNPKPINPNVQYNYDNFKIAINKMQSNSEHYKPTSKNLQYSNDNFKAAINMMQSTSDYPKLTSIIQLNGDNFKTDINNKQMNKDNYPKLNKDLQLNGDNFRPDINNKQMNNDNHKSKSINDTKFNPVINNDFIKPSSKVPQSSSDQLKPTINTKQIANEKKKQSPKYLIEDILHILEHGNISELILMLNYLKNSIQQKNIIDPVLKIFFTLNVHRSNVVKYCPFTSTDRFLEATTEQVFILKELCSFVIVDYLNENIIGRSSDIRAESDLIAYDDIVIFINMIANIRKKYNMKQFNNDGTNDFQSVNEPFIELALFINKFHTSLTMTKEIYKKIIKIAKKGKTNQIISYLKLKMSKNTLRKILRYSQIKNEIQNFSDDLEEVVKIVYPLKNYYKLLPDLLIKIMRYGSKENMGLLELLCQIGVIKEIGDNEIFQGMKNNYFKEIILKYLR